MFARRTSGSEPFGVLGILLVAEYRKVTDQSLVPWTDADYEWIIYCEPVQRELPEIYTEIFEDRVFGTANLQGAITSLKPEHKRDYLQALLAEAKLSDQARAELQQRLDESLPAVTTQDTLPIESHSEVSVSDTNPDRVLSVAELRSAFAVGDFYSKADIEAITGKGFGYHIAGINPRRDAQDNQYVLLFSREDGPYGDSVRWGEFDYLGEGDGDQSESSPGNSTLLKAAESDVPIFFFYQPADHSEWEYRGLVSVDNWDYTERNGRMAYVFRMSYRTELAGEDLPTTEVPDNEGTDEVDEPTSTPTSTTNPPQRASEIVSELGRERTLYLIPVNDDWYDDFRNYVVTTISPELAADVPSAIAQTDDERFWGTTETTSKQKQAAAKAMRAGDLVLFYHAGGLVGGGEVGETFDDPALGEWLWGNPTSRYVFSLRTYTSSVPDVDTLWTALGYEGEPIVRGFMAVGESRITDHVRELLAIDSLYSETSA